MRTIYSKSYDASYRGQCAALPYTHPDEQAVRQHIEQHYFEGVRR